MSESEPRPNDPDVSSVARAVRERWEDVADGPYAGLAVRHDERVVLVYRVPGDALFDDDVRSRGTGRVSVVLVDAPRNRAANEAIRDEIMADAHAAIRLYAAGLRSDGTGVDLVAEGDVATAQAALDARFGTGTVRIDEGGVLPA